MKKSLSALVAAAALVASIAGPAQAEDTKEMLKSTARFPVKALSVASGMVVGIPVAITRRASNRSMEYNETMANNIGGSEHLPPKFFASIASLPFGILVGTGEGIYYGGRNAITGSCEKPFSKAAFSLDSELE